jgi:hypothetical protein
VLLTKCYTVDQTEKDEMGWECGKAGGRALVHIRYWRGNLKEREHFETQSVNGEDSVVMVSRKSSVGAWAELNGGIGGLL